jgi:integrating conjugative element protein (TIGR03749 family)
MTQTPLRRWRNRLWVILVCWPLLALADPDDAVPSDTTERIVWTKSPIAVTLTVGEERLLHFPDSVSVGVPQALAASLRSQSINGTLYLLANAPFDATRLMVRSEHEGPLYVLDVAAQAHDPAIPPRPAVQILVDNPVTDDTSIDTTPLSAVHWGYVALTRYAAQQLYAPARLLDFTPGIVRVPVNQQPIDLVRGGHVEAVPVAAWRAGLHTVTAVKVRNTTQEPVVLDPRELRGPWLTATFQHNRLLPAGSEADATAVYLISDRPFDVSF